MVGGNNLALFLRTPPRWLQCLLERSAVTGGRALPSLSILELEGGPRIFSPYYVWGCNFAIRKSVLLEARGFHPDAMPAEMIRFRGDGETHVSRYVLESGMKCLFHPGASVYHKVTPERMTFKYFRQRGFNQGISDSYAALRVRDVKVPRVWRKPLIRITSWWWRKLGVSALVSSEVRRALSELNLGYYEGFDYHQLQYRENAEVRAWVHKETYFEDQRE
jgi:hypothetical protein